MNIETTIHTNSGQAHAEQLPEQTLFLRRALQADTLFSGISGIFTLADATFVANWLGFSTAEATRNVMFLGIGMLAWAVLVLWVSRRPRLTHSLVFLIIEGNLLWVIGSVILLSTGWLPFSTSGKWTVAIVADVAGMLAILQYVGWRRITKGK
jgi:hypothetical protein